MIPETAYQQLVEAVARVICLGGWADTSTCPSFNQHLIQAESAVRVVLNTRTTCTECAGHKTVIVKQHAYGNERELYPACGGSGVGPLSVLVALDIQRVRDGGYADMVEWQGEVYLGPPRSVGETE